MTTTHPNSPTPASKLLSLPEVQRLVTIARSDNPLVCLGIERREVSWTRFMESRLDPNRQEHALIYLQAMLSQLGHGEATGLKSARAEVSEGDAGRSDLVVEFELIGQPATLVVENKIDSTERQDQLSGYLRRYSGLVFGLLMELGDRPSAKASAEAADVWGRSDVVRWLRAANEQLPDPHKLTADHLDLFEAWDTAAAVRSEHLALVDRAKAEPTPPTEWRLVKHWLVAGDTPFFDAVLSHPTLAATLDRLGLVATQQGRMRSDNGILTLTRPSWTLRPDQGRAEAVNLHFECRGRESLQLDIEPYPYEGSLEKKPDRLAALGHVLDMKAELHRRVRQTLTRELGEVVSLRRCGAPERPSTCKAVGFNVPAEATASADAFAVFLEKTVSAATPVIDREVKSIGL